MFSLLTVPPKLFLDAYLRLIVVKNGRIARDITRDVRVIWFFGVSRGTGNPCGCPTLDRHKARPPIHLVSTP